MSSAAEITIAPALPAALPQVLADNKFVSTLAGVEKEIAQLKIADNATAQLAADLQQRLTRAGTELEKKRKELLRPALDWQDQINATAKPVLARIDAAKTNLSRGLTAFKAEQDRIAREAEAARIAELNRLERIRRDEEEKARKEAERIAKAAADAEAARLAKLSAEQKAAEAELGFVEEAPVVEPEKTETEKKIEALKFAPAPAPVAPKGVAFREELRIDSIEISKLPDVFVVKTANESAIRKAFCVGWKSGAPMPEVPGVVFRVYQSTASTGRAVF